MTIEPSSTSATAPDVRRVPALEIDYALYDAYLTKSNWTEAEKREFLDVLWSIVVQFVDLGFEVHPLQRSGAHVDIPKEFLPGAETPMLESSLGSKKQFVHAADQTVQSPKGADSV